MILALDSSCSQSSIALAEKGKIIREISLATPRSRGGAIFSALQDLLREAPRITRVVAGIGPGSYNGIRTVIAAGWGIARAQGAPLVGVSSLLALGEGEYCAAGDARRGQFYFARVAEGRFMEEPALVSEAELIEKCQGYRIFVPGALAGLPQAEIRFPSAGLLALREADAESSATPPEPLYLKPAHITQPRQTSGAAS